MAVHLLLLTTLFSISLHFTPAFSAGPSNGAVPVPEAGGFAPRFYMDSIPASPAQPFSPRQDPFMNGNTIGALIGNECQPGFHSCAETNSDSCCPNDRYCYLNQTWETQCCALGVTCPGSLCGPNEMMCNATTTTTLFSTSTATASDLSNAVTSRVTTSTLAACCNRACGSASFSCEANFGGQCCAYGFKCGLGAVCVADPVPSTSISTVVSEVPPGCTTSQFSCTGGGGGCCNIGSVCTFQSSGTATSTPMCAAQTSEPASSGSDSGGGSSGIGGLSTGAKAGIGVGVAAGTVIIVSVIIWLCMRRRRPSKANTENASAYRMRRNGAGEAVGHGGEGRGPERGRPPTAWSEPSTLAPFAALHEHGRVYNYTGPDAVAGPFTESDPNPDPGHAPTPLTGPVPGNDNGEMPYNPDYIMRPVEISGTETKKEENVRVDVYELMGNPGSSSSQNPERGQSRGNQEWGHED